MYMVLYRDYKISHVSHHWQDIVSHTKNIYHLTFNFSQFPLQKNEKEYSGAPPYTLLIWPHHYYSPFILVQTEAQVVS